MHLKSVKLKNCKGISDFFALVSSSVQLIDGPNGAGKSSVAEGIFAATARGKNRPDVLRKGAEDGEVKLELDNGVTITLKMVNGKKASLKIEDEMGVMRAPQSVLQEYRGEIGVLDPLAVMNADPIELMRSILGTSYLSKLETLEQELLQRETLRSSCRKRLTDYILPDPVEPVEKPNIELLSQRRLKNKELASISERLIGEIKHLRETLATKEKELEELPALDSKVEKEWNNALLANDQYEKYLVYKKAIESKQMIQEEMKSSEDNYSSKLKELNEHKEGISLPPGFSLISHRKSGKYTLAFNDIPLENLSESEKIRVSMDLCVKLGGDLKFLAIRNGSALQIKTLKEIAKIAKENDYQVLIEFAGEAPIKEGTWHIVDGEKVELEDLKKRLFADELHLEELKCLFEPEDDDS